MCRQILLPWQMLVPKIMWEMLFSWQMLLPYLSMHYILVADVIVTRMMLYPFLFTVRQMLLPHICGRC